MAAGKHTVTLEGAARLRAKLYKLGVYQREAVRKTVKSAALNVQSGAKRRATGRPGPRVQTGRLRNSITHEERDEGMAAVVGTNVEYAGFVEFGTSRAPAYPYLFPAFEEEQPKFLRALEQALADAHRRAAAGNIGLRRDV